MDRKPRTCAACSTAYPTDDAFSYVCNCDLWQGVCNKCADTVAASDRRPFAYRKLGEQHSVQERVPGDGPAKFESLFTRGITTGDVAGLPDYVLTAVGQARLAMLGIGKKNRGEASPLLPWPWPLVAPLIAFLAILLWGFV